MTTIQNLHTHCLFCDGRNSMEEMLVSAINHGLSSIGFSSHWYTGISIDNAQIDFGDIDLYFEEIDRLKEKYPDIEIFSGIEMESRNCNGPSTFKDKRCDYAIGSIHFYEKNGTLYFNDWDVIHYLEALDVFGSPKALIENYYTEVVDFAKRSDYDICGHFDIVTKHSETTDMTFINEKWYKDMALDALDAVAARGKIFEVNTGAIARGFKNELYPQDFLLKRILEIKAPIIISSDAHKADKITGAFDFAEKHLKDIGFKEQFKLTKNGFKVVNL